MSWKSLVTAGLLCVLASPVFAVPTLRVVNGPALDANGNWQWTVSIEPTSTSVIAAELGFDANRDVVSATAGTEFSGANTENPGSIIFGWEPLTVDTNNDSTNDVPSGIEIGTLGTDTEEVFAALGSFNSAGYTGQQTFVTVVTAGPSNTALTGNLQVLGAYGTGGDEGRIAEETGPTTSANYRDFTGTASRTIVNGDINLDGFADDTDFGIFAGQYQPSVANPGNWTVGDFNRDGFTDDTDFGIFAGAYAPGVGPGGSTTNLTKMGVLDPPPGGGSGAVAAPEPASIALIGLGLLGGLGLFRRKR